MKNSIKLTALFLLSGFSLFAATPIKTELLEKNNIHLQALHAPFRVGISIQNITNGNASVEIKDQENHVLLTDRFYKKEIRKAYNLSELAVGDYTFTVCANQEAIIKRVHIYEASGEKTWFIFE